MNEKERKCTKKVKYYGRENKLNINDPFDCLYTRLLQLVKLTRSPGTRTWTSGQDESGSGAQQNHIRHLPKYD